MDINRFDLVIEPNKKLNQTIAELWRYRELFVVLAMRDFKVRYKQSVFGVLWALLRPLLTTIIFTIIFSRVAGLSPQGDIPYALTVFVAMMPWFFFASSFQEGSNSLVANASMISKVYFPRIIIPISTLFVNFIDFCISLCLLFILFFYFGFVPSANILYLPVFLLLGMTFTIAAILWMSALNVQFRDVKFIVPFIVQIGLYVSPVGFASETIAGDWRMLYSLNPMVGVIDGFRWCILGQGVGFYWPGFTASIIVSVTMLVGGYLFFAATERKIADII